MFDQDDPMGASTCVACGECVQACPTGALMPASHRRRGDGRGHPEADREVDSVCPYCGVGCQITYHVQDEQIPTSPAATARPTRTGCASRAASASTTSTSPQRLTKPLIRKEGVPKGVDDRHRPAPTRWTHFREASWEEALDRRRRAACAAIRDRDGGTRAGRLRLGQGLERGGLPVPEAGPHRLRHQQCRPLHPALPRLLGRGADGGHRLGRGHRAVHRGAATPT